MERDQLTRWARRASSAQALALRAKIVLACAEGLPNKQVAADLRVAFFHVAVACSFAGEDAVTSVASRSTVTSSPPAPGTPARRD